MQQKTPTLRTIAIETNTSPETLRKRLWRAGMPAGLDTPLTNEQIEALFAVSRQDIRRASRTPQRRQQQTPDSIQSTASVLDKNATNGTSEKGDVQTSTSSVQDVQRLMSGLADVILIAIVVGHGALIVQELTQMAGQIGRTAGLMVALSIIASVVLSSDKKWFSVSGDLLWFVFVIDFAAIYLHYRAFQASLGAGLALGLACVVSSVAFFSLYAFRSKNSDLFDGD